MHRSPSMGPHKSKLGISHKHISFSQLQHLAASLAENADKLPGIEPNCLITTNEYENVTPLWLAARYNDLSLAKVLLQCGFKTNKVCGGLQMTPLHIAAYNHSVEMVQLLLENDANPNVLDKWNYSPLMYAAIHFDTSVAESLFALFIQHGCDVNFGLTHSESPDEQYLRAQADRNMYALGTAYMREPLGPTSGTALHMAVQNPYLTDDALVMLLNAGADVNARNVCGQTPVIGAIIDMFFDYHSHIKSHVELVLKHGADVNIVDIRGWTPLHYACQRGNVDCIRLLLQAGARSNVVGHKGESPLWILLTKGWHEACQYLLTSGCDMNHAISSMVLLSMNQSADICRFGEILPIEFAIGNRYYHIARQLIRLGCQLTASTWLGDVSMPVNSSHAEVIEYATEVRNAKSSLLSLKHCCRVTIRATMNEAICIKVNQLSLPHSLKEFLTYTGDDS